MKGTCRALTQGNVLMHDKNNSNSSVPNLVAMSMNQSTMTYHRNLRYYQQPDIEERIVGGKPVAAGAFPSFAIPVGNILCGSTLIHDDILVTAAHCKGAFLGGVILGTTKLSGNSPSSVRAVSQEYPNPNFDENSLAGDVMLVKLAKPVTDTSIITKYNTVSSNPKDGATVTVIGFGLQKEGAAKPSNNLLEVQINIVSFDTCYNDYWRPFFGSNIQNDVMICATGEGANGQVLDSCQGDSGGPMFDSNNAIIGIVSFGLGCGQQGIPGVYTRVSGVAKFIEEGICQLSSVPPASCKSGSNSPPASAPISHNKPTAGNPPTGNPPTGDDSIDDFFADDGTGFDDDANSNSNGSCSTYCQWLFFRGTLVHKTSNNKCSAYCVLASVNSWLSSGYQCGAC